MNITILSNRDLASNYALNHLLPALSDHRLCVFLSSHVGKTGNAPQGLRDLKFIEQSLFNQLLSPLLAQPLGQSRHLSQQQSQLLSQHLSQHLSQQQSQEQSQHQSQHQSQDRSQSEHKDQKLTGDGSAARGDVLHSKAIRDKAIRDKAIRDAGGSGKAIKLLSFEALGASLAEPITELNDINTAAGLARLKASEPDLIISIRYGMILKAAAISVPSQGVINLHSGLLPAYRGVMASFWALLNGERQLGTTLHYIEDAGIDTGRVIDTTSLSVNPDQSYLWHVLNLYPSGCELIAATVARLHDNEQIVTHAQPQGGHYYTFPGASDLARFSESGLTLFDGDELVAFLQRYLTPEYAPITR